MVEQTHGNAFQDGFPDLFISHPKYGQRWIDVKVEGRYEFTRAQRDKWPIWDSMGVGIWILTDSTEEQYARLFAAPNWRDYWKSKYDPPDIEALLQELIDNDSEDDELN